ncbi:S-layer homology domain-containing protein [Gorillibacterium sp. sgz500922]|uniref:S-layer homology domain-containing protein n=1 Tax=Gorillibacterium sp. sgz500922 TaxID=3446694 RepID=UPI003F6781EE
MGKANRICSKAAMGFLAACTLLFGLPLQSAAVHAEDLPLPSSGNSVSQDPYEWSPVAIGGGGYVTGIVAHPKEQNLVYIRTDVGGLYRWNEADKSWRQLIGFADRSQVNLYGVDSIAIDPNNPDLLYAALGKYDYYSPSDIYKSADRGETWTRTGLLAEGKDVPMYANGAGKTAERLSVDPNDSNVVYYGSHTKGLFRSETAADGGWTKVDSFSAYTSDNSKNGVTFVLFDPASGGKGQRSQVLYAGAYNSGIYVSRDAGGTWSLLPNSPAKPNRALLGPNGDLYVAHSLGLARYDGKTWTDLTPSGEKGKNFGSVTIDPQNPQILMTARKLSEHNNPIYRSIDGGATWTKVNYTRDIKTKWMPDWHWSSDTSAVLIDPFDSNRVWMTDWYYAWRTDDITASPSVWTNDAVGLETTVNVANLTSPPGGEVLLHSGVADVGGFDHRSLTEFPASSYFAGSGGLNLLTTTGVDVSENNPDHVVRVGTYGWNGDGRPDPGNGGISLDGGQTYKPFATLPYPAAQGGKVAVSASNPNNIVWMPQRSDVYVTMDAGKSWQRSAGAPAGLLTGTDIFGNYYQPIASDKVNGSFFYLYDKTGQFYKSVNGGISWKAAGALPQQSTAWHTVEAAPGIMGEVWVGLNEQGLYRSGDAGESFVKVAGVETAFLFSFGKSAPGRLNPSVFVYGKVKGYAKEAIFRSDDMGETWVKASVDEPFPGNDPNAMTGDRQVHGRVYVGTNGSGLLYGARTEPVAPPVYTETEPPSVPEGLRATASRKTSIDLAWNPSVDTGGSGIKGYRISTGDGRVLADTYGTAYSVSGLEAESAYAFKVQAIDYAGNLSEASAPLSAATGEAVDTNPPATPTGLRAVQSTVVRIDLAWDAGLDADLLGFTLYRGSTPDFVPSESNRIAQELPSPRYTDKTGIEPEHTYYYKVQAVDIQRQVSGFTDALAVRTPADERVDLIVDNLDAGFQSESPWSVSSYSASRFGSNYFHDANTPNRWAKWTPYITVPGEYNVYMLWNAVGDRGHDLPLEIAYDGGVDTTKKITQQYNDNRWVLIGTYRFQPGSGGYVKMTTNGTGFAIADAVKFSLASADPFGATHDKENPGTGTAPVIRLDQPSGTVTDSVYRVSGRTKAGVLLNLALNGEEFATPYKQAYVNAFEVLLPLKEGANTLTVEAVDRNGLKSSASLSLQREKPETPVTGIEIDAKEAPKPVKVGDRFPLSASVLPANATNRNLVFTSSHPEVATVTDAVYHPEDGRTSVWVTAVGAGETDIEARSSEGGFLAVYGVTVEAGDPSNPGNPGNPDESAPGEVENVRAIAEDGALTLTWTDPTAPDLATIRIVEEGGSVADAVYAAPGEQRYRIAGLMNGKAYSYRIAAFDAAGNGSKGVMVSGTPVASPVVPNPFPVILPPQAESIKDGVLTVKAVLSANGTAELVLQADEVEKAAAQAAALDGVLTIAVSAPEAWKALSVELPVGILKGSSMDAIKTMKVDTGGTAVSTSASLLHRSEGLPRKATLTIGKAEPTEGSAKLPGQAEALRVFDLAWSADGAPIAAFGSSQVNVELAVPLASGQEAHKVVVYRLDEPEGARMVAGSRYELSAAKVRFEPAHPGRYAIAYRELSFSDLGKFAWAKESIEALLVRDVVRGTGLGRFQPGEPITRAEFVSMLANAYGLIDPKAVTSFGDVDAGSWYYAAVASAEQSGLVLGKTDGSFGAEEAITRQDVAVLTARLLDRMEGPAVEAASDSSDSAFADWASIRPYALDAVLKLQRLGLVQGLPDGRFAPLSPTTRAEAAVLLYRLLVHF